MVVENRPGGGATTAAGFVAKADPDGYTLLVNSAAHTIAPALHPALNYNPATDFAAVAMLGVLPSVLVVSRDSGFKMVADFVAAANARPGLHEFRFGRRRNRTHLSAIRFRTSAGMRRCTSLQGRTEAYGYRRPPDFFLAPVGNALPFVKDGMLTALVVNSAKRTSVLPDVPTTAEAGLSDAEYPFWIGMFVPAKTPRPIVDRLHGEVAKALAAPGVRTKLGALGVEPMFMTPGEMDAFVHLQIAANAALVKAATIKAH